MYKFFGTGNPNLWSILKPEVELMVSLRMRSNKHMKTSENVHKKTKSAKKCHSNTVLRPNFPHIYVFRNGESEFEVHFETGSSINGAFAHAHLTEARKTANNALKMQC